MNWGSTVNLVIPALVSIFSAANPDVWVVDGPPLGNADAPSLVAVGFDGQDGKAVSGEQMQDGFGSGPNEEVYTVYCAVSAITGSDDASYVRGVAFDIFNSCSNAIALDPTLGLQGTVMRAIPHDIQVTQIADEAGRVCTIRFGVMVTAFTA